MDAVVYFESWYRIAQASGQRKCRWPFDIAVWGEILNLIGSVGYFISAILALIAGKYDQDADDPESSEHFAYMQVALAWWACAEGSDVQAARTCDAINMSIFVVDSFLYTVACASSRGDVHQRVCRVSKFGPSKQAPEPHLP